MISRSLVALAAAPVFLAGFARAQEAPPAAPPKSEVFFALLPSAVQGGAVREGTVKRMVDAVVMAAAKSADVASAWRAFVGPKDRVGIKVSSCGAPVSSTRVAVVEAVAEGLEASGVPAANIVIWDRNEAEMRRAGFARLASRYRVLATESSGGYLAKEVVTAAVMGRLIAGDSEFGARPGEQVSGKSHLSAVLCREVDKVINVPALSDSTFSGVRGALAGMVLENLDNWRRLARAPHFGDPYLAEIYSDPRIGGKVVFTILDALRPQYAGGPFPSAEFAVNYGAIFASRDPVALDATGMRLLDEFRREGGLPPLSKCTGWLDSASFLGVGNAAEDRILFMRTGSQGEVRLGP